MSSSTNSSYTYCYAYSSDINFNFRLSNYNYEIIITCYSNLILINRGIIQVDLDHLGFNLLLGVEIILRVAIVVVIVLVSMIPSILVILPFIIFQILYLFLLLLHPLLSISVQPISRSLDILRTELIKFLLCLVANHLTNELSNHAWWLVLRVFLLLRSTSL